MKNIKSARRLEYKKISVESSITKKRAGGPCSAVADAQNNLALMYVQGRGVPKDVMKAFKLFRLAAEQGHATAQYNLGVMYEKGEGSSRSQRPA